MFVAKLQFGTLNERRLLEEILVEGSKLEFFLTTITNKLVLKSCNEPASFH
jgi:hypothetical protein